MLKMVDANRAPGKPPAQRFDRLMRWLAHLFADPDAGVASIEAARTDQKPTRRISMTGQEEERS